MGRQPIRIALSGTAIAALGALPSLARAASEGDSAGMPQFDSSTFASQLFWLVVILVVFFLALRNVALPRIGGALEERQRKIDDDLDKAAAYREDAESALAAYEKALANAAVEGQEIHRKNSAELSEAAAQRRAELATKLAGDSHAAEARIAAAMKPALANIRDVAVEAARQAVSRLAGVQVSKPDAKAAVAAALKDAGA